MKAHDFCVIGGGIVGLATALTLLQKRPGADVLLLDKESEVAAHQTGHNSGVIHAGIYYAPGSLKATLCRAGAQWTRQFCDELSIGYRNTGKLIVATNEQEVVRLRDLHQRAIANQLDVEHVDASELKEREPNIEGREAIFLRSTGIVDYREVSRAMATRITALGGQIRLNSTVDGIYESLSEVGLDISVGKQSERIYAKQLVVCGGLQADRLAKMAGLDIDFQIVSFRGEYYRLPDSRAGLVNTLIYPVPDPDLPFLGVHLTLMMDGSITVGPNAVLGFAREGYNKLSVNPRDVATYAGFKGMWKVARAQLKTGASEMWNSLYKPGYLELIRKYCPSLTVQDLLPYPAGIRAQAVMRDGTLAHDFLLQQTDRMLHVCNAPSPAATSAMPIADMIADKVLAGVTV